MADVSLTQEYLRSRINYDPETGVFTWLKRGNRWNDCNAKSIGKIAGGKSDSRGYLRIGVDGRKYYNHQLAWLWMTGYFVEHIDHVDLDRSNNKWSNLREADKSQNGMNRPAPKNNKSGHKGIYWYKGAYAVELMAGKKKYYGGRFKEIQDAVKKVEQMRAELHGEFARA